MFQNPRLCQTVCAISLLFAGASAPAFAATIEIERPVVQTASQSDTHFGCGWLAGKMARVSHNNYSRDRPAGDDPSLASTSQFGQGSATASAFASYAGSSPFNPASATRGGFSSTRSGSGGFASADIASSRIGGSAFTNDVATATGFNALSAVGFGATDTRFGSFSATDVDAFSELLASLHGNDAADGAGNGIFAGLGQDPAPGPIAGRAVNDAQIAPVPVPAALPLLLAALGGLGLAARRRRAKATA